MKFKFDGLSTIFSIDIDSTEELMKLADEQGYKISPVLKNEKR